MDNAVPLIISCSLGMFGADGYHEFRFDVLPVIPVFNLLNAVGVPFVDKTVTVSTLSKAIVAALEDETVTGVQRFPEMEELEKAIG